MGDQKGITIPDLSRYRTGILRLRGLRLIHTHLQGELLTQEDLADLALLRLDMIVVLGVDEEGFPGFVHSAHLLPENREKKAWEVSPPVSLRPLGSRFFEMDPVPRRGISEGAEIHCPQRIEREGDSAQCEPEKRERLERSMEELKELAQSSGVYVVDSIIQRPQQISPTTLMGEGKLRNCWSNVCSLGWI